MAIAAQALDILGERQSGQDVRTQNVARWIILITIFSGKHPVMLVDDIGDVTIINDGATILKMLEVEHPAAKVLVELAELQDREVGDGMTSVVIVAAEFLKRANDLVRNKIHPTSIISGFRLAMREACKYVEEKLAVKVEKLGKDSLINCAKTSMSSKLIAGDSDFFSNLVVEAVLAVKMTNARGEVKYPIKLGVQVLVTDPRELEKIRQREADMTKECIEKLLKAGANVVLTTKGIDDMALKYFVEAGAIAVRRVCKEDMRHVAKATGATMKIKFVKKELCDITSQNSFRHLLIWKGRKLLIHHCLDMPTKLWRSAFADDDVVMIKGPRVQVRYVSLILRGANDYMLDEMERALHDALSIVKRTLESNMVVAGGGAVEADLSLYLEYLATTLGSSEQLAIAEFAESLLIIPKVLAVNAAKDATELVAKLRAFHHTAQTKADKKHFSSMGLDLSNGTVLNNLEAGVIEPAMSKVKIIQFATEAAITILRIDDMIKLVKDESQNED
ncbi:hypothetical protein CRYUN_Cryun40dG0085100 [Craigia yunnanensis]